jgi:hypothetical protein
MPGIFDGIEAKMSLMATAMFWVKKDPSVAVAWAKQLPEGEIRNTAISAVASELANKKDIDGAYRLAIALPEGKLQTDIFASIASALATDDPEEALEWTMKMPGESLRNPAIKKLLETWAGKDPEAAARWAEKEVPEENKVAFSGLAREWAKKDLKAASTWAEQLEGNSRYFALSGVADFWLQKDPVAGAEWAMGLRTDERSRILKGIVVYATGTLGVDETAKFAEQMPEGEARDIAMSAAASKLAEKDPDTAAAMVQGLPEKLRIEVLGDVASEMARKNPETAVQWAMQLPKDGSRTAAIQKIGGTWAEKDPEAAARWAEQIPEEGKLHNIGGNAGKGLDAAKLLALYDEESLRDWACWQVAYTWADKDPVSAASWASRLPAGSDRAVSAVAARWGRKDPAAAAVWGERMLEGDKRKSVLSGVIGEWSKNAPETAREWIGKSSLPKDLKAELLQSIEDK